MGGQGESKLINDKALVTGWEEFELLMKYSASASQQLSVRMMKMLSWLSNEI
jgi:hypothetical protein